MAKVKEKEKIFIRASDALPPLSEEERKKRFPNVPPPTLSELKERKNKKR